MADSITMSFSGDRGQSILAMFAAAGDPEPPLEEFLQGKRDRIVASMLPGTPLVAAAPGEPPLQHSGGFAHTMTYNVEGAKGEVGSNDPRAAILNEGGTIAARDKLLTIPIAEESYGKRARDFPDLTLTFRRTFEGLTAFLVREHEVRADMMDRNARQRIHLRGKHLGEEYYVKTTHEAPDFLFVLKHSVDLFEHTYLAWEDEDYDKLIEALKHNWDAN